ncbi:hypothetical protein BJX66DRAFT_330305 [Aspergillus keveii]|uniref:Intraflagellar transport protein 122 homolog n=1 Tax=Aspergillus keveii TaxID=714993 RepID=A0ABR4FL29_9EURO
MALAHTAQPARLGRSSSDTSKEISAESITIAIFCALVYEAVAVEQMLDEEYTCHPEAIGQINYVYSFGRINEHRIVIAQPHQVGTVVAAQCATAVSHQFSNIRFALMDSHAGVIQYDFGKYEQEGFVLKGCLNKPPSILISADKWLAREELKDRRPLERALERITKIPRFSRPNTDDILFDDKFHHINKGSGCEDCETSNEKLVMHRPNRQNMQPVVHRGLILSGNGVIKNPRDRDYLQRYTDAICFEMEAAGIMDEISCLIVRGICDYADTHKQDGWHFYAAAVAAAYCRTLLCKIDSRRIVQGAEFDSYENQHEDCLEGTRIDLLRELEEWSTLPGGKCIFWLNGKAGTGKSTISRTAASLLRKKGLLGASFFFKRGEGDRGSAKKLFPTLAAQLTKCFGEQFEKLLLQPLLETDQRTNTITTRVIVIDALDECQGVNDIEFILKLLPRVRKLNTLKLQFLLTSRPELPIMFGFREITDDHQDLSLHQIPEPIIEHDICLYFEIRFAQLRNRRSLPQDWPGGEKIKALVQHSVPLFISASTIYRFISDDRWNPEKRIQAILANTSIYVSKMYSTYISVLHQLLVDQDEQDSRQLVQEFRELIGIVILLATPLSVVTISQLVHMDLDSINNLLRLLHSVLEVPRDPCIPVRLLHSSFRDFLLDINTKNTKESKDFWIDKEEVHTSLAKRCFKIMDQMLKKNICDLPRSGIQCSELNAQSIDHSLPPKLQYACRYWAKHLTLCKDPAAELSKVFQILRVHFLHWVEAMSILGYISEYSGPLWDPSIGELQESFDGNPLSDTWITSIDFSPDGKLLASCSNHSLSIWDTSTGELWQIPEGHSDTAEIVAFCPKGCLLASGSRDKTVRIWDLRTGKTSQIHDHHSDTVASISYSPDTRLLASCSADSQLLASGSDDKSIKLFDVGTGELKQTFKSHDRVALVTFSPGSRLLAASSFSSTELWDLTTGKLLQTLEGHTNWTWLEKRGGISILEHQWLCVEGERRLWLPEEYRPTCLALNGNVLALGHRNGRISYVASDTFS